MKRRILALAALVGGLLALGTSQAQASHTCGVQAITSPAGGSIVRGTVTIGWTPHPHCIGSDTFKVEQSSDGGSSFSTLASAASGSSFSWNTTAGSDSSNYKVRVTSNRSGTGLTSAAFTVDNTAPALTFVSATPAANGNGWNDTDVALSWTCTDNLTGTTGTGLSQTLTSEGAGQSATASCVDGAGNSVSNTHGGINIDKTAPVLTFDGQSPAANGAGWNNTDVTLSWSCTDNLTGSPATANLSQVLSGEGAGQSSATASCTDLAGRTSTDTATGINIDKTSPSVSVTPDRTADSGIWYNAPLSVTWDGTDDLSGIASCGGDAGYSGPDVSTVILSGGCTDVAGNSAPQTFTLSYDATAPTGVTGSPVDPPDSNSWYNNSLDVAFSGTDPTSGIDSCTSTSYAGPDGAGVTVAGTCTDGAGNTSDPVASSAFDYDATAPTGVTGAPDRSADNNGWYNAPVGIAFTGADATSGIDSCTTVPYAGPDGSGLTESGSCTDAAGNTSDSAISAAFDYDATAPTDVTGGPVDAPDSNGWYNNPVDVAFTGSDATSDIDSCDTVTHASGDGSGLTEPGTCTDVAGNTSDPVASSAFDYDATAPSASVVADRAADSNGWYNHAFTATWSGSDATSGIDACTPPVVYSGPDTALGSLSGTCTDVAGNASDPAVLGFQYDGTAAVATITPGDLPIRISILGGSVSGLATDNLSGVDEVKVTFTDVLGASTVRVYACGGILVCEWTVSTDGLTPGPYMITASADDVADNSGLASAPTTMVIV
jgi:hypothetical protein